ncbi:MAG: hypothetical protein MSG77_01585 [Prevotella sp.]|nr:hypothetical protein [Prevotella sp.]
MAKKITSVQLPGSIKNIVHSVQKPVKPAAEGSETTGAEKPQTEQQSAEKKKEENVKPLSGFQALAAQAQQIAEEKEKDRSAPAAKKLPKAEGKELAKEYTIARDRGDDSWQLFLGLAKEYKLRDSKLATVYIDSELKQVLDRLKSASSIKMPSTALLSAIVARFVFDHEQDIKDAIYGEGLL